MKFTSRLDRFDSDLWGHHVEVPADVADFFLKSTGRRVVATIMGSSPFHCAILQMAGGRHFININKQLRDRLGLILGQEVQLSIAPDQSRYGLPISEEFEEVLRQDPVADAIFHTLSPGKQRTLIYSADNVKSSHIKLRRALVIMEHLKMNSGKLDFRALNEEIKAANRRERLN